MQNPFADSGNGFCTKKVLVNGKDYAFDNSSAFIIYLDSLHFDIGDTVNIEIQHGSNCKPKVLNAGGGSVRASRFLSIAIDTNGILNWSTLGEFSNLPFIIEQFRWNKWVKAGEVNAKSGPSEQAYSFKLIFHSGENQFRVKQYGVDGVRQTSAVVKYISKTLPITFRQKIGQIIFSSETMYEIYNSHGDLIDKGFGKIINTAKLEHGAYYLNYDNSMGEFFL